MAHPSRLATCVLALFVAMLVACGSGGEDAIDSAAAPAEPSAESTACFPDRATILGLSMHITPDEAEKRIGCRGYAPPEVLTPGTKVLQWVDMTAGNKSSLELRFLGGAGLYERSAYLGEAELSSCTPTQAAFDQLAATSTLADVVRAFGCEGILRVDLHGMASHEQRFVWGPYQDPVRPMAMVNFTNGVLSFKASARLR